MSPRDGIIAAREGCATGGPGLGAEGGPEFDADHQPLTAMRAGQVAQIRIGWRRVVYDGKSRQITLVAGPGLALIVMQIADAFAHEEPTEARRSVAMLTFPENLEVPGLIDDCLDAQHPAQLVVHLEGVSLDEVLDASARLTDVLVVGLRFAVEAIVQRASQVAEKFPGREGKDSEGQESGEQLRQNLPTEEDDIRGILGLIDDPIVAHAFEFLVQQRIELA
jgi:hypothetical protein